MTNLPISPRFLVAVLWADAVSGLACGVLHLAAAGPLSAWFGLPQALLTGSGAALLVFAAWAAWTAHSISRGRVLVLAAANALWVLGCLELLFTGAAGTLPGHAWLLVQAVAVGALAAIQWLGVRGRSAASLA